MGGVKYIIIIIIYVVVGVDVVVVGRGGAGVRCLVGVNLSSSSLLLSGLPDNKTWRRRRVRCPSLCKLKHVKLNETF